MKHLRVALCLALALSVLAGKAKALTPDEILLIVNSKVPAGQQLAEFYAQQRAIPAGRILALDLPFPQEEMSAAIYDAQVIPKVREFLAKENLQNKVKCLVTFWGVPIRIQRRSATPEVNVELAERDKALLKAQAEIAETTANLEAAAREIDPTFKPAAGDKLEERIRRAEVAAKHIRARLASVTDPAKRDVAYDKMLIGLRMLAGRGLAMREAARPDLQAIHPLPYTQADFQKLEAELLKARQEMQQLEPTIDQRKSRDRLLEIVRSEFGVLQYLQALQAMRQRIDTSQTEAAFDSELSLIWVNSYPRQAGVPNVLQYTVNQTFETSRRLMVMRIDGPTEAVARRIIADSIKAENEGLTGIVALDARGNQGKDAYGQYDATIRRLAELLKAKTTLDVRLDDKPDVYGPDALKDVMLYCGWYKLRSYVKSFSFHPGAVSVHIASHELVSLRAPGEKGWGANLLADGSAVTIGAVSEPYLSSFPPADEFYPLLLTGKLTLAEAYWRTTPMASWMQTCIGDPLYKPFAKNAPLKVEDLSLKLQAAINPPAKPLQPTLR